MCAGEFAQKPVREINEMRPLVDQLAATGCGASEAPFPFIARSAAMTVAPSYKHQRPELVTIDDLARLQHRRMEAVIVADLCDSPSGGGGFGHGRHFGEVASTRLFN